MNFDELPVGKHNEINITEEYSFESTSLPKKPISLPEQLVSKNTKVRFNAMTNLVTLFNNCTTNSETLLEHYKSFPKYLSDTHPGTQEKALDAFSTLIGKLHIFADSTLSTCIKTLLKKCMVSGKTQIRTKTVECILKLEEIEGIHNTLKDLIYEQINSKIAPKVVVGSLQVLIELLINFGPVYFPVKESAKSVAALADSTNHQVRTEVLNYLKEAYKWDKPTVLKVVEGLRQAQQEELKKYWEEAENSASSLKPVNETATFQKYGTQWCTQLMTAKKWNEKRDKLEELLKEISNGTFNYENFAELGTTLTLLLRDSNVVISNLILKIFGQLAKVLRKRFAVHAKRSFLSIVQKCKDKKSVTEAQKCLDNLVFSLKLEDMNEIIQKALEDRSPLVKSKVCKWIELSVIPKAGIDAVKDISNMLGSILAKLTEDTSSEVRESALACLGRLKQVLKESNECSKIVELSGKEQENTAWTEQSGEITNFISEDNSEYKEDGKIYSSIPSPEHKAKINTNEIKNDLSPEDATKLVFEYVPTKILALFDIGSVKGCQKGLQKLNEWIIENQAIVQEILKPMIVWLKRKINDFKESNHEITKEFLSLIKTICNELTINSKFAEELIPPLLKRINDLKLKDITEVILLIADAVTPSYVITLSMDYAYTDKNLLNTVMILLGKLFEYYGADSIPLKRTIDYANYCLNHNNSKDSAKEYIELIQRVMGDSVRQWLVDDNSESFKNKSTTTKPKFSVKVVSKQSAISPSVQCNVTSQMITKIVEKLNASSMKERQKAKEDIEKIISHENNKLPLGEIATLMIALKERMNEPCKNLAKGFITLVGNLALFIGSDFTKYSKIILQPLMSTLGDKQASIRAEAMVSLNKISEAIGPEIIFSNIGPLITKDNPDIRTALLTWILNNKNSLKNCDLNDLVKPLVRSMQDRSKSIRTLSENVVKEVMNYVGYNAFAAEINDLKPTIKAGLLGVLDKYKSLESTCNTALEGVMQNDKNDNVLGGNEDLVEKDCIERDDIDSESIKLKPYRNKLRNTINVNKQYISLVNNSKGKIHYRDYSKEDSSIFHTDIQANTKELTNSKQLTMSNEEEYRTARNTKSKNNPFNVLKAVKQIQVSRTRGISPALLQKPTTSLHPATHSRKGNELLSHGSTENLRSNFTIRSNSNALHQTNAVKSKVSESNKLKEQKDTIKNSFGLLSLKDKEMQCDHNKDENLSVDETDNNCIYDKLKDSVDPTLLELLFSDNIKDNITAVNELTEQVKDEFSSIVSLCDILFKWVATKLTEQSNPIMMKTILQFLKAFFSTMKEEEYKMQDIEAVPLIPTLCEKLGIGNIGMKNGVAEVIELVCEVYDYVKVADVVKDTLVMNADKRTKSECLKVLTKLASKYSVADIFSSKDVENILSFVNTCLKTEVLDFLEVIHEHYGELIWNITDKETEKILRRTFNSPTKQKELSPQHEEYTSKANLLSKLQSKTLNTTPSNQLYFNHCDVLEAQNIHSIDFSTNRKHKRNNASNEFKVVENLHKAIRNSSINSYTKPTNHHQYTNNYLTISDNFNESHIDHAIKFDNEYDIQEESHEQHYDNDESKSFAESKHDLDNLEQTLEILRAGNVSQMVEALMNLNEMATSTNEEDKECLSVHCNQLIDTFTEVLEQIFDKPIDEIPIRFAKYFITVVDKICANKFILKSIEDNSLFSFMEQLLSKLLYDKMYHIKSKNEGEYITNSLNSVILRLLENCNPTQSLTTLIRLLNTYKAGRLSSLIVKCILKFSRIMGTLVSVLDVPKLLLALHSELLTDLQNSEGFKIAKTLTSELAKAKGKALWEDYKSLGIQDLYIERWIKLRVGSSEKASKVIEKLTVRESSYNKIKDLCKNLGENMNHDSSRQLLSNYLIVHPKTFREKEVNSIGKFNELKVNGKGDNYKFMKQKMPMKSNTIETPEKFSNWMYQTADN